MQFQHHKEIIPPGGCGFPEILTRVARGLFCAQRPAPEGTQAKVTKEHIEKCKEEYPL